MFFAFPGKNLTAKGMPITCLKFKANVLHKFVQQLLTTVKAMNLSYTRLNLRLVTRVKRCGYQTILLSGVLGIWDPHEKPTKPTKFKLKLIWTKKRGRVCGSILFKTLADVEEGSQSNTEFFFIGMWNSASLSRCKNRYWPSREVCLDLSSG
jgi:hypothetical protein